MALAPCLPLAWSAKEAETINEHVQNIMRTAPYTVLQKLTSSSNDTNRSSVTCSLSATTNYSNEYRIMAACRVLRARRPCRAPTVLTRRVERDFGNYLSVDLIILGGDTH